MIKKTLDDIKEIMKKRFGHDTLLSVATTSDNIPYVRIVNSYYEDGCFYTVTYSLSNKMKQLSVNPSVAVCGEWFTAHGIGKNLGWIKDECNKEIADKLRNVFSSWYNNGHVNEEDQKTCILCTRLSEGILFNEGSKYIINFSDKILSVHTVIQT
ncbi:MAG: pyridoxamine 5'-phosphate oxidase family protein [Clostridia bacterium]|jgi:hypothetical protein